MWDKLKRKVLVIAAILMMICSIPKVVNAAPVVINVGTGAEFLQAINDINNGSETDYVINLTANIDIYTSAEEVVTIRRGNVTIIGNGHEITNILGIVVRSFLPPRPTLTLGKQDGSDILKINGSYTGTVVTKSLFEVHLGSVINMYSGVDIYNRAANDSSTVGVVFTVDNSTLNMYGGSIKNCSYLNASTSMHPMIYVFNKGTFNMSGGEISNNNISNNSFLEFRSAAILVTGNAVANLTGGVITKNIITVNDDTRDTRGGAINVENSTLNISNMQITENEILGGNHAYGGAIFASNSNVVIDNSVISNNKVSAINAAGGGIYNTYSSIEIKNSFLDLNSAINDSAYGGGIVYGGAIYTTTSNVLIDNSVITNNKATKVVVNDGKGGGIYATNSNLEIKNSLVAFNIASLESADIQFETEGATLILPNADAMNAKQSIPYTNAITGWYVDDFSNRWSTVNSTDPFTTLENDVISGQFKLVAGYENAVLMSYDPNGGQGSVYHQHIGANAKVKGNVAINITRSGYNFTGWNTEADGSGIDYTVGASLTAADEGIILYAQWDAKPVTPDTGDRFNPNIFMSLMILSGIGLVALTKKYKNKYN